MLKVTILGCGGSGGVPQIGGEDGHGWWGACDPADPLNRRTRSSILIEGDGAGRLLVDTGPDLRAQFLACGVPGVDAILYTHDHADHIMGMDEVRILNRLAGRPLEAFGTERTLGILRQRFDYAFLPSTGPVFYRPAVDPVRLTPGAAMSMAGHAVRTFRQDHAVMDTVAALRPRRTVLTHMGPDLDHGWLKANLPPGIEPAHDGMELAVPGLG